MEHMMAIVMAAGHGKRMKSNQKSKVDSTSRNYENIM